MSTNRRHLLVTRPSSTMRAGISPALSLPDRNASASGSLFIAASVGSASAVAARLAPGRAPASHATSRRRRRRQDTCVFIAVRTTQARGAGCPATLRRDAYARAKASFVSQILRQGQVSAARVHCAQAAVLGRAVELREFLFGSVVHTPLTHELQIAGRLDEYQPDAVVQGLSADSGSVPLHRVSRTAAQRFSVISLVEGEVASLAPEGAESLEVAVDAPWLTARLRRTHRRTEKRSERHWKRHRVRGSRDQGPVHERGAGLLASGARRPRLRGGPGLAGSERLPVSHR
jgi:hypothetical protein